jgi:uncharacterized protein
MNLISAQQIIERLNLKPLPEEGGYFAETYRSSEMLDHLPGRYPNSRCVGTAIFYLLTSETVSKFHRLRSDEMWHFYQGDAVDLVMLKAYGDAEVVRLGSDIMNGERSQVVVPHGVWQGARLIEGGSWALMGCTVAPGFEFVDREMTTSEKLLKSHPKWLTWIELLG